MYGVAPSTLSALLSSPSTFTSPMHITALSPAASTASATATPRFASNVHVLPVTPYRLTLHTTLRNRLTARSDFIVACDTLSTSVLSAAIALPASLYAPASGGGVITPTGAVYSAATQRSRAVVGVSSLKTASDVMTRAFTRLWPALGVGRVLVMEGGAGLVDTSDTAKPCAMLYAKIPAAAVTASPPALVMVLEPVIAKGTLLCSTISALLTHGIAPADIMVCCLLAAPEGVERVSTAHPKVQMVVGCVDTGLTEEGLLLPGVGDLGLYLCSAFSSSVLMCVPLLLLALWT